MNTYLFHVSGMRCASCVARIENELSNLNQVSRAKVSLTHHHVEVVGEFGDKTNEEVASELSSVLEKHGYTLSVEKQKHSARWRDFTHAVPFALGAIGVFVLLQKLGLVNLIQASKVTYSTAFVVGLVASVSTCMAVVGGLVLSLSSNFAKGGDKVKPQVLFHVGRLVSFFVLGGVIGVLGSTFQLGSTGTLVLGLLVALVLLVLGINLLDLFPSVKRFQLTLPGSVGKRVHALKEANHTLTPLLLGTATFFLPCGFTQAMQFYTLTTGSFWTGALTMGAFALGTLPVLALLSFSSLGLRTKQQSSVFFKAVGLVIIFFSIFNLLNSLAAAGIINPVFNF